MFRVFPAPAGINRHYGKSLGLSRSVPRASGDKPLGLHIGNKPPPCSPRQRG
ncbi:hypothetical protein CR325_001908 [Escherichia coli]|nr:hypothetical protein [Escherichia coli]